MFHLRTILLVIIIFLIHPSDASYRYAGCYTQIFHDSFFSSSHMEPTLCFRLCDTPIIYLQRTVCRCSGSSLTDFNRQKDLYCSMPCAKPADSQVQTANTCGGSKTYSVYVDELFYTKHGHLFNYQIPFSSCELWKRPDFYETIRITLETDSIKSSLNKMERCAAACLDRIATVKSIAFNNNDSQCLCINSIKYLRQHRKEDFLIVLPNNTCDHYCDNKVYESKIEHKFQCGSTKVDNIWAVYELSDSCPDGFVYIKEIERCMFAYKTYRNPCSSPAKSFIYDGSIGWSSLLKIIEKFNLNDSFVTIDIDDSVDIKPAWRCSAATNKRSQVNFPDRQYSDPDSYTRYILEGGCLKSYSNFMFSHMFSYKLCTTNPVNKYSSPDDNRSDSTFTTSTYLPTQFCPKNWFDLNGHCYRMSDQRKTIEEAKSSCITVSENDLSKDDRSYLWLSEDDDADSDDDRDKLKDLPNGHIVQFSSIWQSRLGFFLLDTFPDTNVSTKGSSDFQNQNFRNNLNDIDMYRSSIAEFQMMNLRENSNSSTADYSCIVASRKIIEENERPVLDNTPTNNCLQPRHVLCETRALIVENFRQGCFHKPLTLDLPAFISNYMTYELCLSVCQQLNTILALVHMNKCYCFDGLMSKIFNFTTGYSKYEQNNCGNPCHGNQHERCGNESTIVAFSILNSRRLLTEWYSSDDIYPEFMYDSCIHVYAFDPSTTYQFRLDAKKNYHPRHCLEICTYHQQKYALMNSNTCLCTNIPLKDPLYHNYILPHQYCSMECSANYFYSCGNQLNRTIYSLYVMQPKCRHGFEIAENHQQCVYSHFSTKRHSFSMAQSYCKSLSGVIAKVNDVLEIQDILPESILNTRLFKTFPIFLLFKLFNDTRYYWIDRASDNTSKSSMSERLIPKCSDTITSVDKNCLVIKHEKLQNNNETSHERCISESDQCSFMSAIPVCVDQHFDISTTVTSFIPGDDSNTISVKLAIDYSCGNDTDFHLVDEYCYKISFHETTWNNAKDECQRENAILFIPEKRSTLKILKSLILRRRSYASSGFVHIGVMYNYQNRTVIQASSTNMQTIPESNTVYDLCEKTFYQRYTKLLWSKNISLYEQNAWQGQQIGCAYTDVFNEISSYIRCDEIPCNRTAIVICQKAPNRIFTRIEAKRQYVDLPVNDNNNSNSNFTATRADKQSRMVPSKSNFKANEKTLKSSFIPIFYMLSVVFIFIVLTLINTFYNHRLLHNNTNSTQIRGEQRNNNNNNNNNNNFGYSALTSANEFDLN